MLTDLTGGGQYQFFDRIDGATVSDWNLLNMAREDRPDACVGCEVQKPE